MRIIVGLYKNTLQVSTEMAWNFGSMCNTIFSGIPKNLFASHSVCNSIRKSAAPNWSVQRLLSTESFSKNTPKAYPPSIGPKDGYTLIYKFPYMGPVIGIHRAKRLCLKLLPIAAPASIASCLGGITSTGSSFIFCSVGIVLAAELYLLSILTTNHVGFIYASPDMSEVQIAYVDSQGKRRDDIVPKSDIVPLPELHSNSLSKFFYKELQRYSTRSCKAEVNTQPSPQ